MTQDLKQKEHQLKSIVDALEKEIYELMYHIPNVPHNDVVIGKNADDSEAIFENGKYHLLMITQVHIGN